MGVTVEFMGKQKNVTHGYNKLQNAEGSYK